jgi:hypothetical protein
VQGCPGHSEKSGNFLQWQAERGLEIANGPKAQSGLNPADLFLDRGNAGGFT